MRLQSDPTIIYGLTGGKGPLGRPILKSELDAPNPYSTYQIDGLPPGPIANPGRASLEATAHPMKSNELYFVADGTGGHVFSETLDEHSRNVAHWRALEKQTASPAPIPAAQTAPAEKNEAPAEQVTPAAKTKPVGPITSPRSTAPAKKKSTKKKTDAKKKSEPAPATAQ
jgi:UPF0755 protein